MTCSGNTNELCGGPNRLNVFQSSTVSGPVVNPGPPGWGSLGCYRYAFALFPGGWKDMQTRVFEVLDKKLLTSFLLCSDSQAGRTLRNQVQVNGGAAANSVARCTSACGALNYKYAGVEYAQECCE